MSLDFTQWCGFNFRQTLAGATDGTNEIGVYGAPSTQAWNGEWGWNNAPAATANSGRAIDRRIYGHQGFTSGSTTFAIACPNGNYYLRFAHSATTVANTATAFIVLDTVDSSIRTNGLTGFLSASGSAVLNGRYITQDGQRCYKCSTAGTYTSGNPSGTGTGIADGGTARFDFLGSVLYNYTTGAGPTLATSEVIDVDTAKRTEAAWPSAGTGQPVQAPVTIANGGITICRYPSTTGYLRHVALKARTTPLQDAVTKDEYGQTSTAPVFFAQQPAGYPLLSLSAATGSGTWSIDPDCDLAPYVAIDTTTYATPCVVTTGVPMPDSLDDGTDKTLGIIQTDASSTVTGSPYTTTLPCSVVSSGGRAQTSTSVLGLISTQSWMNYQAVEAKKATRWMGYSNQSLASTTDVTDTASFIAAWNALTPDQTSWYRIRLRAGDYTGACSVNKKNFGTGGMLVEPYPGETPTINWNFNCPAACGLHVRGLDHPGNASKMPSSPSCWIFGDPGASNGYFNKLKFSGNRFGYMFEPGAAETDIKPNNETASGSINAIQVQTGVSVEIVDNVFDGSGNAIYLFGVGLQIVERNEFLRMWEDCVGWCPIYRFTSTDVFTQTGEDKVYRSIRDNVPHAELDYVGLSNGKHGDFDQLRQIQSGIGTFKVWGANSSGWSVGQTTVIENDAYQVASITTGTTGATRPTGTGTGIVDGGVTWNYVGNVRSVTTYEVFSNRVVSQTINTSGAIEDRQLYFSNQDAAPWTRNCSVFDVIECSNGAYGCEFDHAGSYFVERSTMLMGGRQNASVGTAQPYVQANHPSAKVLIRNSIVGAAYQTTNGAQVGAWGNHVVSLASGAADPNLKMTGPFATYDATSRWGYDLGDSSGADTATLERTMRTVLGGLTATNAGAFPPASTSSGGVRRQSGLSLGLRLGL